MYKMQPFFVEIQTEYLPGEGWIANAAFSRIQDYKCRTLLSVPKTRFRVGRTYPTRGAAERDAVLWARQFVSKKCEAIEAGLSNAPKYAVSGNVKVSSRAAYMPSFSLGLTEGC